MRDWLKSLLGQKTPVVRTNELQAKLRPINGQRMFGEVEFEIFANDSWELEAEVDFRDGQRASHLIMYLEGKPVMNLAPDHVESEGRLSSRTGDILCVIPAEGMPVEIKRGGEIVLEGTFRRLSDFQ